MEIDACSIERRFSEDREALQSLAPYGITSAEALLPHFIADERVIREAVRDAPVNTLDHPRYEFYHPWDYATGRVEKVIANQAFIVRLKRLAYPDFFAEVSAGAADPDRLRQTFAAEFAYLEAFRRYLAGAPRPEIYRMLDGALAAAPWNDSLRARIYVHYLHFASVEPNADEKERLTRRARALYGEPDDGTHPH